MKTCNLGKKIIMSVVLGILILGCYVMMFRFSADNAGDSSAISSKITKVLMKIYDYFFASGPVDPNAPPTGFNMLEYLEKIVRKVAHFTEFFLLGSLSISLFSLWMNSGKKCMLIVFFQLVISAAFDEIHQFFVPGRYASVSDVILDTIGGMTGVICLYFWINRKRKVKKNER